MISWNVTNSISAIRSANPMPLMTFRYLDGISLLNSSTAIPLKYLNVINGIASALLLAPRLFVTFPDFLQLL